MQLETNRAKQLAAYLKDKDPQPLQGVPVELSGEWKRYPVYRIPLKYLIFNIRNGRFTAELLEKEEQLKRKLDPAVEQDAKIIRKLLLDQSETETKALKEDLRINCQREPGIITFDGAVINANRRMAVLMELFDETRDENKYNYLNAAVLPPQVDQKDLWRIEADLQFAKDFRLEYGPVNELLKLKEGLKQGLTAEDISKSLLGRYSAKKVNEKIEILKLIDSYLKGLKKPDEYHLVQGSVEKFNSLQANVIAPLRKKGKGDADLVDIISVAFSIIDKAPNDISHWGIRKLRDIALCEDAEKELAPILSGKPSKETVVDAFSAAQEIVEDIEKQDRPERLVKRALTAIKSIRSPNPQLSQQKVKLMLKDLIDRVQRLLKAK